ncbi:sce7726 family protein [Actinomyces vulturis]|uniref:sce7726 family protein n=1 Tax=Actinomyces vulturis TaxID=1857645 RepID=UPI00082C3EC3|nr:sce7726 family protein [Actinomyces vulturis]
MRAALADFFGPENLQEFRCHTSRIDMVWLNPQPMGVEIKSDKDTSRRLAKQLSNYSKVFPAVYVTLTRNNLHYSKALNQRYGVIAVDEKCSVDIVRPAHCVYDTIDPAILMDSLRIGELLKVHAHFFCQQPNVPNTMLRQTIYRALCLLDIRELSTECYTVLENRLPDHV